MFKKVNDWLHFNPPDYATTDEWVAFDKKYRTEAPFRHFCVKVLPGHTYSPISNWIRKFTNQIRYRIARYHVVSTDLSPGYYDKDTLLLCSAFTLLKDFVEVEKASMEHVCNNTPYKMNPLLKYVPYYKDITFRSRELGLNYLEWETKLECDEFDDCLNQAQRAEEVRELYLWWVDVRPARVEPECPENPEAEDDDDLHILASLTEGYKEKYPEHTAKMDQWYEDYAALEDAWEKEDTEMLIRLVNVRKSLWT